MIYAIDNFEEYIRSAKEITIIGHFNPDGDSVGSVSALYYYLKSLNISSTAIIPNDFPSFLDFLNTDGHILIYSKETQKAVKAISSSDLIICLDLNTLSRTEMMEDLIRSSHAKKILIDHHPSPEEGPFDKIYSETELSSTCELLFWILMNTSTINGDVLKLSQECALSLATGMITDTNNFNNSVKPSTFEMSSELMRRGIDFEKINKTIFGSFSSNRMRLMGHMLAKSMIVDKSLKAAYIILSLKDQKRYNYSVGDSEGFVNLPLLIKGVEVSALFTENTDNVRVSLRSSGNISVNQLSRSFFNGGGHEKAAGGKLNIPIEHVPDYFVNSLKQFLKNKA